MTVFLPDLAFSGRTTFSYLFPEKPFFGLLFTSRGSHRVPKAAGFSLEIVKRLLESKIQK